MRNVHLRRGVGLAVRCLARSKDNPYAAPAADPINTFYGRGEVPIRVVRDGPTPKPGKFIRRLATGGANRPHPRSAGHARQPAAGYFSWSEMTPSQSGGGVRLCWAM